MLEMTKGCSVPCADTLCEQYHVWNEVVEAQVNASKMEAVLRHFIAMQEERLFFILELPVNELIERRLRQTNKDSFHKEIYYIDGLDKDKAGFLLNCFGELLIHDGVSKFGFGVHDGSAEILRDKYNIITLFREEPERYNGFFEAHGIFLTDCFVAARNMFSEQTPGICMRVEVDGRSVFDLPGELSTWGIYLAEQTNE